MLYGGGGDGGDGNGAYMYSVVVACAGAAGSRDVMTRDAPR